MQKQVSQFNNKKVYLLGKDKEGIKYWLEEPSWNCRWYWGFGYIETYTNSFPNMSKDISSHQHWERTLQEIKEPRYLIGYAYGGIISSGYTQNPYTNPYLIEKTFNQKEGWELGELFKQFYFLQEAAEMFGRGKANIADAKIELWKDEAKTKEINEIIIPKVTKRILEILTLENKPKEINCKEVCEGEFIDCGNCKHIK